MAFCSDEDPIGALATDGADPAFSEGVHPRRLRCGEHDLNADRREDRVEGGTELGVTVANEVCETVCGCACRKCRPCWSGGVVLVEDAAQSLALADVEAVDFGPGDRLWRWL